MPKPLINATIDDREDDISDQVYAERIDQRAKYAFRPKHAPTPDGKTAWMCPARGPGATATCPLASTGTVNLGMPTVAGRTPILNPPADPDICCTNKTSITIPVAPADTNDANIAKYFQDYQYKGPEWLATYSTLRNTIEGFNGFTKSATEENTEEPARRRVRGYAYQTLAVAILILSSNLRKVASWLRNRKHNTPKTPVRPPCRNSTSLPSLVDYLPPDDGPPLAQPA